MMKKILLPFLGATCLTGPSIAADDIEQIQITASRVPVAATDIASPVSILTADDLAARQIFQVADALKTLPGISVARSGGIGGQTQLRLRGAEANQTLILLDGIEMNDPAAGDEVQFEHLTSLEIERIEIIRGPMSSQWGSDAVSGVINIVTKKASGPSLTASAEFGSFGTYRGTVGAGTAGDGWHIRGGLSYSESDGTNASRLGNEKDGYENLSANIKAGVSLAENLELTVTARHTQSMSEFDGTDFTTGLPADGDKYTDTNKSYLSATFAGTPVADSITQQLRFTWIDTEIENFADQLPDGLTASDKFGVYFDNSFLLTDGHTLTLALDHEDTEFKQRGVASPWGDPNQDQEMQVTGYLAEYNGTLAPEITVTATVRHDDNSDFANSTSWRFGGVYKLDDSGSRIFANVSKGQKAPTFIERFGYFSDVFFGNPNIKPEKMKNIELGFEAVTFDGAVKFGATAFRARLTDEIDGFVYDPATFAYTAGNKAGKSKRDGFEVTLDAALSETVSLSARYSYVNAKEQNTDNLYVRELRRPKHQGGVILGYQPTDDLGFTLDAAYTGSANDIFYPPWPNPSETVTLDNYLQVRLSGSYKINQSVSLYGRAENLLDETYEDVYGFANPGAAFYAGLKFIL